MSSEASKPPTPPAAFRSALLFPEDANLKAYATPDSPSENPLNQPGRATPSPPAVDGAPRPPRFPSAERSVGFSLAAFPSCRGARRRRAPRRLVLGCMDSYDSEQRLIFHRLLIPAKCVFSRYRSCPYSRERASQNFRRIIAPRERQLLPPAEARAGEPRTGGRSAEERKVLKEVRRFPQA